MRSMGPPGASRGATTLRPSQAAGSSVKTTTRTLTRCAVSGHAGGEIRLDVEGEGFLRHMVRNLAGTLVEIGRGRWPVERAAEILASGDRGEAGPTAPAHGLCLIRVDDDGGAFPAGTRVEARALPLTQEVPSGKHCLSWTPLPGATGSSRA